jgi:hypothetical protein
MLSRELWVFYDELVLILRASHPKTIGGDAKWLAFVRSAEAEQAWLRE